MRNVIGVKIIIAGSRSITDYADVKRALLAKGTLVVYDGCGYEMDDRSVWERYGMSIEVVSGKAPGVDTLGEMFANKAGLEIIPKPAAWKVMTPGCRVKTNYAGEKYNADAGHIRNKEMGDAADALLAVWDMISPGTRQMMNYMRELKKPLFKYIPGRYK